MKHHTITVNYSADGFKADPDPLRVNHTDTVSFQLGAAPPNSKFKITMNEPQLFSAKEVTDSQTSITLIKPIEVKTTYHCQLLDSAGTIVAQTSGHQPGGGMVPA